MRVLKNTRDILNGATLNGRRLSPPNFPLLSLIFELINIALFIIYNNLRGVRYCH